MISSILFALIIGSAVASPIEDAERTRTQIHGTCNIVSSKCTAELSQASAYCSSVEHISTYTETIARKTITRAPSCTYSHVPNPVSSSSGPGKPFSQSSVPCCRGSGRAFVEDVAIKTMKPPKCFGDASTASASCSCLTLQTPTRKVRVPTATAAGPFVLKNSKGHGVNLVPIQGSGHEGTEVWFTNKNPNGTHVIWVLDPNGRLFETTSGLTAAIHTTVSKYITRYNVVVSGNANDRSLQCSINKAHCGLECADPAVPQAEDILIANIWQLGTPQSGVGTKFTPLIEPVP